MFNLINIYLEYLGKRIIIIIIIIIFMVLFRFNINMELFLFYCFKIILLNLISLYVSKMY